MVSKKIRLHAYQIAQFPYAVSQLKEQFALKGTRQQIADRIKQNSQQISESAYIMVLEGRTEAPSDFVCGRFVKFRETNLPLIIDKTTALERIIELGENDSVEEVSHFIWNLKHGILFGQYNFYGVRYFTYRLEEYLNNIFSKTEIDVSAVPNVGIEENTEEDKKDAGDDPEEDSQTEKEVKKEINVSEPAKDRNTKQRFDAMKGYAISFDIKLAEYGLKKLAKDLNLSPDDQLAYADILGFSDDCTVELIFRPGRKKDSKLANEKIKNLAKRIMKENEVKDLGTTKLKVETKDAVYDLINDSLLEFTVTAELEEGTIYAPQRPKLYDEMKAKYLEHIKEIKEALTVLS
jgi:hypothetical protein